MLWPKEKHSLWDLKNEDYIIEIEWSKNYFEDYKKLSQNYANCGKVVIQEILNNPDKNEMNDSWFMSAIFLMRQSLELGLKALIIRVHDKNPEIQEIFQEYSHDLSGLYNIYLLKGERYLTDIENSWLIKFIKSLEEVDKKSDLFRFPFDDEFLKDYRDKYLSIIDMGNNLSQAFNLIWKCISLGTSQSNFNETYTSEFLVLAKDGIGNCYLWQSIYDKGFHTKLIAYSKVAEFLLYECNLISLEEKLFPCIFLLRNFVELRLKVLFYIRVNRGIKYNSKRRSHNLKKDLWRSVRPMIENYGYTDKEEGEFLDLIEKKLNELSSLDKRGDAFRYPTTYSLEYMNVGRVIDVDNLFKYIISLSNFFDGCSEMLENAREIEIEIQEEIYNYY